MDDDDDDREFSRSIVFGFFEQAESTFDKMENDLYAISFDCTLRSNKTR